MTKRNIYIEPYHWKLKGYELYRYHYFVELAKRYICKNDRLLDVGCGDGKLCSLLVNYVFKCTGIDIEKNAIIFARKLNRNIKNLSFLLVSPVEKWPFDNNSKDVVSCFEVIEHLEPKVLNNMLNEVKRVLRGGEN